MKTNVALIVLGLILLAVGVYRICPVKIDLKFKLNNIPILVMFVIALV